MPGRVLTILSLVPLAISQAIRLRAQTLFPWLGSVATALEVTVIRPPWHRNPVAEPPCAHWPPDLQVAVHH